MVIRIDVIFDTEGNVYQMRCERVLGHKATHTITIDGIAHKVCFRSWKTQQVVEVEQSPENRLIAEKAIKKYTNYYGVK